MHIQRNYFNPGEGYQMSLPVPEDSTEPQLHFPSADGQYVPEHLPYSWIPFEAWFGLKRLNLLRRYNRETYYWHTRYWHSTNMRKREDIKFLCHVWKVHDGQPTNPQELKWFNRLWAAYGKELIWAQTELAKDTTDHKNIAHLQSHPYARAYAAHWLLSDPEIPEEVMLYHGMDASDFAELIEKQELQNQRNIHELLARLEADEKPTAKAVTTAKQDQVPLQDLPTFHTNPTQQSAQSSWWAWWLLDGLLCAGVLIHFWVNDVKGWPFWEVVVGSLVITFFMQVFFVAPYGAIKLLRKVFGRKQKQPMTATRVKSTDNQD